MSQLTKEFDGRNIRIYFIDSDIYFSAVDVCKALDLKNSRQQTYSLDKYDVRTVDGIDRIGRKQKLSVINEGALYQLIFRSRKDSAKKFKKWVTHEVLPSLRKNGNYNIPRNLEEESSKNRNSLTDAWKDCGIEKPHQYIQLTLQEYKAHNFQKGKRKKDLSMGESLLLSALESMEALNLFSDPKEGYYECKGSVINTANNIKKIIKNSDKEKVVIGS